MSLRVDFGTLRPPKRLANGHLRVDGTLTRVGVFEYRNPDGSIRREYRPPNEVFKQDSLDTFALVPVTDDHPPEMLTADNAKEFAIGTVGELIRRDGDHVSASLMVYDADTITKMEAGKVQLSCGYEADIIDQSGVTPEGERYDAIQTNIRGNHVAIVSAGRAGSAKVRMDACVMITDILADVKEETTKNANEVKRMDELTKELASAYAQVAKLENRVDAAEKSVEAEKTRADKAEAERDSLKAEVEAADKSRQDAQDLVATKVKERVALETVAAKVLDNQDVSELSDREIKVAVVKKIDSTDIADDKNDVYVDGRFDSAVERAGKAEESLNKVRETTEETRNDAGEDKESTARAKMLEANQNAWKGTK